MEGCLRERGAESVGTIEKPLERRYRFFNRIFITSIDKYQPTSGYSSVDSSCRSASKAKRPYAFLWPSKPRRNRKEDAAAEQVGAHDYVHKRMFEVTIAVYHSTEISAWRVAQRRFFLLDGSALN